MNVYTTIVAEFLIISSTILLLFKFRNKLGLAPLYILLGAVQFLLALSGTMSSFKILGQINIYPESAILFSSLLFAVLLIYIKEGVVSARILIVGIIISNFFLSVLFGLTYILEVAGQSIKDADSASVFLIDYKYFITGTTILLIDFIVLVSIYQFLISKIRRLNFFIILFISLFSVLIFDALVFNISLNYGSSDFKVSLIGHIIGKSISALMFSLILYVYLKFIDDDKISSSFIADQNRDIFSLLRYRKKYLDLRIEKIQVEQKLTSQLESTLDNISDGFVFLDTNWYYTFVNIKAAEFLDRSQEDLIGKNIWTQFPEIVGLPLYNAYNKAVKTQQTQYIEEFYEPLNKWFENRIYPSPDGLAIYFKDITEQKKAQLGLIESTNYLDNIINNIGDPVFVKDEQSKFLLVNDSFCKLLDLTREDIIGKTLVEDFRAEEMEGFLRDDRQVLKTGKENIIEEKLTVRGGKSNIIVTKKTRYIDSNNKKYLIGVIRDITNRKNREKELKKAQQIAHIGNWYLDIFTDEIVWSDELYEMYGFDPTLPIPPYSEHEKYLAPESWELLTSSIENTRNTGIPYAIELKTNEKIGTNNWKWLFAQGEAVFDSENKIIALRGTAQDISERKIAEDKIKESEEKYRTLFEQSMVGIGMGRGNEVVFGNKAMMAIWKYDSLEEYKKKPLIEHIAPEYRELIQNRIKAGLSNKGKNLPPEYEYDIICRDGEIKNVRGHTSYIKIGDEIYSQTVVIDVTDRKKAEDTLKDTFAQLELAIDTAKLGVWTHDIKTDELTWNNELFDIFGISPSEFDYSMDAFKKMIHPEDLDYVMEQQGKVFQYEAVSGLEFRIIRPNKEVRYIDATATPIIDEEENLIKIVGINLDVTERKKSEKKLEKSNLDLIAAVSSLNELKKQLEDQNVYLKKELDLVFNFEEMVYGSAVFGEVLTDLERVAPTDATVLILGESGTGKELLARALHNLSLRKDKPFIKVNCSAIPTELIESELFGHKKGSFTGAVADKVGKFQLAQEGTLFLDEIGDLPLAMQPKLLRFLQEGEMEVVGGTTTRSLDVRIVAATNKDLKTEVNNEQFREDLYFRLNVFPIEVPALRDRKEDIPLLVEHFVDKFGKKYRKNIKYIADSAMQNMRTNSWPGNIRELENLVERSVILSDGETLSLPGFGSEKSKKINIISGASMTLNDVQRNHILSVLDKTNWKVDGPDGAAQILDIKPSTFRDKMKKLGIKRPD